MLVVKIAVGPSAPPMLRIKAQGQRAKEGQEDTALSRGAQKKAFGIGNQRSEIGHTSDSQEDKRRVDAHLYALV